MYPSISLKHIEKQQVFSCFYVDHIGQTCAVDYMYICKMLLCIFVDALYSALTLYGSLSYQDCISSEYKLILLSVAILKDVCVYS